MWEVGDNVLRAVGRVAFQEGQLVPESAREFVRFLSRHGSVPVPLQTVSEICTANSHIR